MRPYAETLRLAQPDIETLVLDFLPSAGDAAVAEMAELIAADISAAVAARRPDLVDELEDQLAAVGELHSVKMSKKAVSGMISAARLATMLLVMGLA